MSAGNARNKGFTLIELMVALAIIALLISIAAPNYAARAARAEEAVLRENLRITREALDKHYADAGRYPGRLEDLVEKKYLRRLPEDPVTRSSATWVVVPPEDPQLGGVYDLHSGARGNASDGTPYAQW
jgi:general secretion pathway protein G